MVEWWKHRCGLEVGWWNELICCAEGVRTMPSDLHRQGRWLPVAVTSGAVVVCAGAALFFALSRSTQALIIILALCTAIAVIDLAARTDSRSKPK
jgi:hypothetical protein